MALNTLEAFFELLRKGIWQSSISQGEKYAHNSFVKVNWADVYQLSEEQSVVGLLAAGIDRNQGSGFEKSAVPQEWSLQFIGATLQIEQQNKAMNEFVRWLINRLRKEGIYAILVKGQGIAQCYERPLWRASGDVDLFLSDTNYEKAREILKPLASTVEEEYVREKHLGMTIDDWVVELHGHLYCGLS